MRHRAGVVALTAALALTASLALARERAETEPNDNISQANAQSYIGGNVTMTGAISTPTDIDFFRVLVAADSVVRFESFDASATDCAIGTTVTVYDSVGAVITTDSSGSGVGSCGALVVPLAAGTYYVSIQDTGSNGVIPAYRLEVAFSADAAGEVEPNDSLATANALAGTEVSVRGGHQVQTDIDTYAITIGPHGGSIRAEIVEGSAAETCESNGIDSFLALFNSVGTQLATDDDRGRGFCSLLDGTGSTPTYPAAHDLAPGTYYLQVSGSSLGSSGGRMFDYRLLVAVVPKDSIFKDGFETGNLLAWSAAATDGGDLSVNSTTPINGLHDIEGLVDDTNSLYVEDQTPLDEDRYRARFRLDPATFDPGTAQNHFRTRVFLVLEQGPTRRLAAVVLKKQSGQFSLMGRTRLDDGSQVDTTFVDITAAPHAVEIEWVRATSSVSADGEFRFWIDGVLRGELRNLQNNVSSVDFVRMGALSVKSGASGTLFWDDLDSRRRGYVGP